MDNTTDILRRNLRALMDAVGDGLRSGPSGVLQLEAATTIGKSTLYRILDPRENNPTQLDTLEQIAQAYSLQVWQLLVPRLDPLDPPEYVGSRRMNVLRSVFQQTHDTAFGHGTTETEERHPAGGDARSSKSAPDHRLPSGGDTAGHPDAGGRKKRHRHSTPKKA